MDPVERRGYEQQLARVERWYDRLKAITQGQVFHLDPSYYGDDIYAFFLNCYHLKDWIQSDPEFKDKKRAVEDFVNETSCLSICAAICNESKYGRSRPRQRKRRGQRRSVEAPKITAAFYGVLNAGEPPSGRIRCTVAVGQARIDALELATECLRAWEKFIDLGAKRATGDGVSAQSPIPN